jgi:hypothetical protein
MIVIASAAYVGYELAAEFGEIPPCMLPLGNRPLLEWQVNALRNRFPEEKLVLSLPLSYEPSVGNAKLFSEFYIQRIGVPDGLKLAESLLFVINTVGCDDSVLRILHGDTLIDDLPLANDVLAVAPTQTDYAWEIEALDAREEIVWCGYFSFANTRLFTKYLALARGDFVAAVRSYDEHKRLTRHNTVQWCDLGHINTYFASRAKITTERSFNSMNIEDGLVRKSGSNHRKISAEVNWYLNVPPKIKLKTPQLLEYGDMEGHPYYVLEYLNLTPLNELFVHGRNPTFFWDRVFSHCDRFFLECITPSLALTGQEENSFKEDVSKDRYDLIIAKTWTRLDEFAEQAAINLDMPWELNGCMLPSLHDIASRCITVALGQPSIGGVMHGDFCFSNILFDSRADAIKVIDPRGISHAGEFTIYGDITYDLAKLMHSVVGLYDFILAEMYHLDVIGTGCLSFEVLADKRTVEIQQLFMERSFAGGRLQPSNGIPHVILLFLSMLPLHADKPKRQLALMANALRLFSVHEKKL